MNDDWTEDDWRDLHETIEAFKKRMKDRRDEVDRRIGLAVAEIADRWEEIWGSGTRGRASEDMMNEIITKHIGERNGSR